MKKSTIIFIESGMLAGIIAALYAVPSSTPLWIFLAASGACFVAGNLLLVWKMRQTSNGENIPVKGGFWPRVLRVMAILAAAWLFVFLAARL